MAEAQATNESGGSTTSPCAGTAARLTGPYQTTLPGSQRACRMMRLADMRIAHATNPLLSPERLGKAHQEVNHFTDTLCERRNARRKSMCQQQYDPISKECLANLSTSSTRALRPRKSRSYPRFESVYEIDHVRSGRVAGKANIGLSGASRSTSPRNISMMEGVHMSDSARHTESIHLFRSCSSENIGTGDRAISLLFIRWANHVIRSIPFKFLTVTVRCKHGESIGAATCHQPRGMFNSSPCSNTPSH